VSQPVSVGTGEQTTRADLRGQGAAGVLRPGIRTYKPRRTRITDRAARALVEQAAFVLEPTDSALDPAAVWGAGVPVVVEIGFGDGLATAEMAQADRSTGVLAIDVHTPGVGALLARIADAGLTNVRVMEADALTVLARMVPPHSLAGVRSYFPDPWPKARHHKRRLVQPEVLDLVRSRLVPGGTWHLATDWAEYADWTQACFAADARWQGGVIARPAWRPVTRYERRALRDGRAITDLVYATDASPTP
jgi:tRNA (guanine-N7-)-methyltransferase